MDYDERMRLLQSWNTAVVQVEACRPLIAQEQELRKAVMAEFFPTPKEGVNNLDMGQGWTLKGTYRIDRKVDEAALPAVKEQLRELGVNADTVVRYKPEVATTIYKTLSDQARRVFDTVLTIKPGSPTVELIPPKDV